MSLIVIKCTEYDLKYVTFSFTLFDFIFTWYTDNKSKAKTFNNVNQINKYLSLSDIRDLNHYLVVDSDDKWTLDDVKKELNIA